jgi:hypothetical protein
MDYKLPLWDRWERKVKLKDFKIICNECGKEGELTFACGSFWCDCSNCSTGERLIEFNKILMEFGE